MKGRQILAVTLVGFVLIGALIAAVSAPGILYRTRAQVRGGTSPEDVVTSFYDWYLDCMGEGPERNNPLADGVYHNSALLTEGFVAEVDALLNAFECGGYDPFLLTQDVPTSVSVGEAVVSGDTAYVSVETDFAGHVLLVTLTRAGGAWKIDDIGPMPDAVVKSFYNRYLAYIGRDGGPMRNPLIDGYYRECPELSAAFVTEVDETIASFDRGGYDPILLAQDVPVEIEVEGAKFTGDTATVTIQMFWGGNPQPSERVVTVSRVDGNWRITGIGLSTE